MNILVLGKGKTGSLAAEIAKVRGHATRSVGSAENAGGAALTREALSSTDVIIDFTSPYAIMGNIEACAKARKNMVVGTTGWYEHLAEARERVDKAGIGFLFGANFSVGVNLMLEAARAIAPGLKLGYAGQIVERHHVQKKDKPSGTAVAINNVIRAASGNTLLIESIREGDIVGDHEVKLESENDVLVLQHSARSRRGFAEGAVKAAEWIQGKTGFYDFKDIWRELR